MTKYEGYQRLIDKFTERAKNAKTEEEKQRNQCSAIICKNEQKALSLEEAQEDASLLAEEI